MQFTTDANLSIDLDDDVLAECVTESSTFTSAVEDIADERLDNRINDLSLSDLAPYGIESELDGDAVYDLVSDKVTEYVDDAVREAMRDLDGDDVMDVIDHRLTERIEHKVDGAVEDIEARLVAIEKKVARVLKALDGIALITQAVLHDDVAALLQAHPATNGTEPTVPAGGSFPAHYIGG